MINPELIAALEGLTIASASVDSVGTGGEDLVIEMEGGRIFVFHSDMVDYDRAGLRLSERSAHH